MGSLSKDSNDISQLEAHVGYLRRWSLSCCAQLYS